VSSGTLKGLVSGQSVSFCITSLTRSGHAWVSGGTTCGTTTLP
jgi:hypothetical protein